MADTALKISAFIVTLNEASHIQKAVDSLSFVDEIIVVDSGSTDNTVELAKAAGAQVHYNPWSGYGAQKKFALNLCKHEWCLNIDGDEIIPQPLAAEIIQAIEAGEADVIRLHFNNVFMGSPLSDASHKIHSSRVFKKSSVSFDENKLVHEGVSYTGKLVSIKTPVLHYGYESTEMRMSKQNKYSGLAALQKHRKGRSASLLKLTFIFPLMFIKAFIFRRYFMDGTRGFIHSFIEASYSFLKEAKLYELSYRERAASSYSQHNQKNNK